MKTNSRLEYLDSVRGIAAFAVFIGHFHQLFGRLSFIPEIFHQSPLAFVEDAGAAVSMFFVLSGLVLSINFLKDPLTQYNLHAHWWRFYLQRLARIFLPFFFALLLSFFCLRVLYQQWTTTPPTLYLPWLEPISFKDVLKNSFLFRPLSTVPLMPQMWSLVIEMNFSLWMPFLISIGRQSILGLQAFVIVGLCFASMFGNHKYIVMFVLGMTLSYFFQQIQTNFTQRNMVKLFCFLIGFCLYSINMSQSGVFAFMGKILKPEHVPYLVGIGSSLILLSLIASPTAQKILEYRPLLFLGKISYSFYLLHFGVLICFSPFFIYQINSWGIIEPNLVRGISFFATAIAALVISWIFYEVVEKPAISLSRKAAKLSAPKFMGKFIS